MNVAKELARIFANNMRVCQIDLKKNQMGDEGIAVIMRAIKRSRSIISLNFASNELTHKGA